MDGIQMIDDRVTILKSDINELKKGLNKMGTTLEKVQEIAAKLSLGVEEIAKDIQTLKEQLAGAGTPEEVEAILQPIIDRLNLLGQAQ